MNLPTLLRDYAAFNHWANQAILQWLGSKPADLLDREVPSSFPTLRATLLHIWAAEDVWLQRLKGTSPTHFIANAFQGDLPELYEGLSANAAEFRDFLAEQEDDFFEQAANYQDLSGNPFTQFHAEMILHCLQHSTYHRGQIVTMARALGLTDVPRTDYIYYVRTKTKG